MLNADWLKRIRSNGTCISLIRERLYD